MKNFWKKVRKFLKKLFTNKGEDSQKPEKLVFEFIYGGFNGNGAVEDPEVQIGNFKMDSKKMSYKWTKNDMAKWGYVHTDAKALACAFFYDEVSKKYLGGKWEWISSSRTSREWKNIYDGYNGWRADKFFAAKKHGFCIISSDGKKRTNFITD